jgi:hypothetical protein
MRTALAVIIFLTAFLAASYYAPMASSFLGVGGNFGQNWISGFKAQNPQLYEQNLKNDLWTWGDAPKGSIIVNGRRVADPYYFWKSLNYTSGWLGRAYVDPNTGYPIYAYVEPYTRRVLYFYVDPNTERAVYLNAYPAIGSSYYSGIPSFYSYDDRSGGTWLSPTVRSHGRWG